MKKTATLLAGVAVIEPEVFGDDRGFFLESYNKERFDRLMGQEIDFVQDNHSRSRRNVLRGLHYQLVQPQGKLVRAVRGEIFDVAVDIRRFSPTFGCWTGVRLSEAGKKQLWIPAGFAHGFLVLSEFADVLYKTTDYYAPGQDRCIRWNDPDIGIQWPLPEAESPVLSERDLAAPLLKDAEVFE
ncbi:MAG: dTDP-4-dehydrorhamnose 3,5-epimerase [Gammaproteobacteria bacterium]